MCSYLTYNGVQIALSKTVRYTRTHLHSQDGTDYIGTKVLIEVEGVYSPFATSYSAPILPGDPPTRVVGFIAPDTDAAIRHYLAQPRCRLTYVVGSRVVVESPADGYVVDISNGPTPQVLDVVKITERTWHVRFRVETTVNECPVTTNGLLSNRWSMAHSIGEDRLTTIMTQGVAIFRTDRLAQVGRNADSFRDDILPPCPQGFRRMRIDAVVNPIGNMIEYRVLDQEQFVYLGANAYGVVDFRAVVSMQSVPVGDGALSSVASSVILATFEGTALGTKGQGYRSGNLLTWLTILAIQRLNLPVGGNKNDANKAFIPTQVGISAEIDRPSATLSMTVRMPPVKDAKDQKPGLGPLSALDLLSDVRDSDLFDPNGGSDQMPRGKNSRGYYLGELYAQAIRVCLSNCNSPTVPEVIVTVSPTSQSQESPGTLPSNEKPFESADPYFSENLAYSDRARDELISYFEVRSHYKTETGTRVSPVAGNGTEPPLVFRMANPITMRVVQFTGERVGGKPPTPHPFSNDFGEVLVGSPQISWAPPVVAPDGVSKIYRVSGAFCYARVDGKSLLDPGADGLSMGAVPWARFEYIDDDNKLLRGELEHGITDPRDPIYPV